jgi:hypothetical protein
VQVFFACPWSADLLFAAALFCCRVCHFFGLVALPLLVLAFVFWLLCFLSPAIVLDSIFGLMCTPCTT